MQYETHFDLEPAYGFSYYEGDGYGEGYGYGSYSRSGYGEGYGYSSYSRSGGGEGYGMDVMGDKLTLLELLAYDY